jgi:putative transposase
LKNAIAQVLGCPWQRCTVHFLREAIGHARREQQPMLAALIRPIFNADSGEQASELLDDAIERLQRPLPKVAALLERAEEDLLAFYAFPADHWRKLRSTNPLERLNREIGRRTDVVGIFPDNPLSGSGTGEFSGEFKPKTLEIGCFWAVSKTAAAPRRPSNASARLLHDY